MKDSQVPRVRTLALLGLAIPSGRSAHNLKYRVTPTVPAGAKTGKITLTTAGGTAMSHAAFTVNP